LQLKLESLKAANTVFAGGCIGLSTTHLDAKIFYGLVSKSEEGDGRYACEYEKHDKSETEFYSC
jgi:hypothetical protein